MRNAKKLLAMLLAMILCVSLVPTATAEDLGTDRPTEDREEMEAHAGDDGDVITGPTVEFGETEEKEEEENDDTDDPTFDTASTDEADEKISTARILSGLGDLE